MDNIYDTIIIGGGTAGMTAAIYSQRNGKKFLIIEETFFGGQIISASEVENYPGISSSSGYDFAQGLQNQLTRLGVETCSDHVSSISQGPNETWQIHCNDRDLIAKTVIIAVGTKARTLGLHREKELLGKGISYCATCDGLFYKNKTVAVVGGGNSALEEALYLSLLCKKVYLIHRGSQLSGDPALQKRIMASSNIHLLLQTSVRSIHGKRHLEKIELSPDPVEDPLESPLPQVLLVEGLFIAIGRDPQNAPFADIVELDEKGYILAGEDCHTSAPGIFAAGDCRTKKLRQLVTAASDGAIAAAEAGKLT